jgi:glycosyltransferase involved in cell wall biosynthesis
MFPNSLEPLFAVFVKEKAKALSKLVNLEIIVPVSYFPFLRRRGRIKYHEEFDGLSVTHPRYLALPNLLFSYRWLPYYITLKNLFKVRKYKYDIINVEWVYPDCFAAMRCAHKYGKKVVVTIHGNEAIGYLDNINKKKKYIQTLLEVDHIVSVSNDLKNKMVNDYGIHESKISVLPNGIDLKKFFLIEKGEARRKLGIKHSDNKICVSVTRLSEEKSLHTMIEALKYCDKNIYLYIIGDGHLKDFLKEKIEALAFQDRVFLLGPLPHNIISWWMNAADFFLLSSIREGCPVVIHEALACGVPIVSTNIGGIPDIVENGIHGLLCPPDNPEEFAKSLMAAISNTWDRLEIAKYGQSYTWDRVAENMVQIYRELLS